MGLIRFQSFLVLPRDGPHIKGQQYQYQIGEYLSLNCTSGKSHPASHLQWFVNEQPVSLLAKPPFLPCTFFFVCVHFMPFCAQTRLH